MPNPPITPFYPLALPIPFNHPPPNPYKIAAGTTIHFDFQIPSAGFNGSFGCALSCSLSNLMRSRAESGSLRSAADAASSLPVVVEGTRVSDESFGVCFESFDDSGDCSEDWGRFQP